MINLLDINAPGGKEVIEAFARLERTPDFKLIVTKLRFERGRIKDHMCEIAEDVPLRQHQGAAQILDDIIEAAETARDLA
jgi:hypothetical protein